MSYAGGARFATGPNRGPTSAGGAVSPDEKPYGQGTPAIRTKPSSRSGRARTREAHRRPDRRRARDRRGCWGIECKFGSRHASPVGARAAMHRVKSTGCGQLRSHSAAITKSWAPSVARDIRTPRWPPWRLPRPVAPGSRASCTLVRPRLVAIATVPLASEPAITAAAARAPTHPLRRPGRSRHREHLPALGTSTTHHPERPIAAAVLAPALVPWLPRSWLRWLPIWRPRRDPPTPGGSGSARSRASDYATSWITILPRSGSDLHSHRFSMRSAQPPLLARRAS